MSQHAKPRARDTAADWIDRNVPPAIQRAVVSAVMLVVMGWLGVQTGDNKAAVQQAATNSAAAVRSPWMSNTLVDVVARLDRIEQQMKQQPKGRSR